MKDWILLLVGAILLTSCRNEKIENASAEKFERSWNSDSAALVLKLRTEIVLESPQSAEGLYCKSWLADQKGDLKKAIKTVDSLAIGYPGFEKGIYLRANLKAKLNDYPGALSDFGRAIKKNPTFFEAFVNRGTLHFQNKHTDLALKDFQKANQIKPNNKMVVFNIGNAFMLLGKPDEACKNWIAADSLGNADAKILLVKYCYETP